MLRYQIGRGFWWFRRFTTVRPCVLPSGSVLKLCILNGPRWNPPVAAQLVSTVGASTSSPCMIQDGMSPEAFIRSFIETHEGGLSLNKADTGNWVAGKLIGSKFGVTANALAAYRGVNPGQITAPMMAALTIEEAVKIGLKNYYAAPKLDMLPWNRVTASVLDMAWGAGPSQAIKLLQRMVGVADDGKIGPATRQAYIDWLEADKAKSWGSVRDGFYQRIVDNNPTQKVFLNGWRNRTASFLSGTSWWKSFG